VDVQGIEYRRLNLASRYPFGDPATLRASDGLVLGADVLLDARLAIPGSPPRVALTAIASEVEATTFRFGWPDGRGAASARVPAGTSPEVVEVLAADGRPAGILVLDADAFAAVQGWPYGEHAFPDGSADLAPSCLEPAPAAGVAAVGVADGAALDGIVHLIGSDGVVLQVDEATGDVVFHAVGDPLSARKACRDAGGTYEAPRFVRTINGVGPDASGRFLLAAAGVARGSTILRIEPDGTDGVAIGLDAV